MNPIGMHYGFWSHNWDEIAYIPLMEKLAWLGFDICEVASAEWGYYDDARLRELKACADHNGLGITYSIGLEAKYDLASDDPAVRENGIRHVTRILESMPKVGAAILNGVSYAGWQALPDHGITLDEKRRKEELALESMSRLMKVAEDCGVLYCCEVVNRFEQYLLNTAKEGVEFVKRLGSPNARVLLDTFHMNIEEDSMVDAILEAGPWLGHFHVGENNRRPAGSTNRLPWKDMAAALKQVNYQGAIVMEPFVLMFHSTHSMPSARETLMTLLFTSPYGGRIRRGETPSVSAMVSAGKTIWRIMLYGRSFVSCGCVFVWSPISLPAASTRLDSSGNVRTK